MYLALFQSSDMISQQFDASACWWTWGPDANLQAGFYFLHLTVNGCDVIISAQKMPMGKNIGKSFGVGMLLTYR